MRFKVITPHQVFLDKPVTRIVAESPEGAFGLLPRHIDYVAQLKPGVVIYDDDHGREYFLGTHDGTLVKCGALVSLATRDVIEGHSLESLKAEVEEKFQQLDQQERKARTALARLEAGLVRRFIELEKTWP
ncbi:MAG: F0F1 ATP synthase subunit epsilon [Sphingomonadales bacterium]